MDKRTKERLEREKLKTMIENYPTLKIFLENVVDNSQSDLKEVLIPVINDIIQKSRMEGVHIGFNAGLLGASKKIQNCKEVKDAVQILKNEANRIYKQIGIKK